MEGVTFSEERKIDEVVTRTATILHSFAAIAVTTSVLQKRALLLLILLTHEKQLNTG